MMSYRSIVQVCSLASCALEPLLPTTSAMASTGLEISRQYSYSSTSTSNRLDWVDHTASQFSLQPSFFSPLYAASKQHLERDVRRQLAAKLLRAHKALAQGAEGYDAAQVETTAMHRANEIERLAAEIRSLGQWTNITRCTSMNHALGFYSLLEEESVGRDADAEAFHDVVQGHDNVWQHWNKHFVGQYANTPGLEPLHAVYSRPEHSGKARVASSKAGAAEANPLDAVGATQRYRSGLGGSPTLDLHGVSHATGFRKSSEAHVRIAHGDGQIFINGKLYDAFFSDLSVRMHVLQPFILTGTMGKYDVMAKVSGGGPSAMAQAVQHGIAKALSILLTNGTPRFSVLMRRDARRVERKKPGRVKARKGFAYVRR